SKSYTALGLLRLEERGDVELDEPVSTYLPWFHVKYRHNVNQPVTLRQLLHHSSGIPWESIFDIPDGNKDGALEETVRNIIGIHLFFEPGSCFYYATINYDIIGLVIEKVSGLTFKDYMHSEVFEPLGLTSTRVGGYTGIPNLASGYKSGLFKPLKFDAPVYKGNEPSGYIIANGKDVAAWLRLQLGLQESSLAPLIKKTQLLDKSVRWHIRGSGYYAMGWLEYNGTSGRIGHSGLNPNYAAEFSLNTKKKHAFAVLANCSSRYVYMLANYIGWLLFNERRARIRLHASLQSSFMSTAIFVVLCVLLPLLAGKTAATILGIVRGVRKFQPLTSGDATLIAGVGGIGIILLAAARLIPKAFGWKYFWKTAMVWKPRIFTNALWMTILSAGLGYLTFILSLLFPL
ncbi:MAG: beta-lactamase family protein, partial [bacterium]|nr:beta-lactamase family protein [bacterium]